MEMIKLIFDIENQILVICVNSWSSDYVRQKWGHAIKYLQTLKLEGVIFNTPKDHKKQINSNWDKELTYRSLFCSIVISPRDWI